jgi:hypothetical protein
LVDSPIQNAQVQFAQSSGVNTMDTFTIQLTFVDGSIGTVHYFANGSRVSLKNA